MRTSRYGSAAVLAAILLMGAGCAPAAAPAPSNAPPSATSPAAEPTVQQGTSGSGSVGSTLPTGAPVTGYEDDVSNPSQP